MIRTRADQDLDAWISDAEKSLMASFARGILKDRAAVRAAIKEPWSNGQTEGQKTEDRSHAILPSICRPVRDMRSSGNFRSKRPNLIGGGSGMMAPVPNA